MAVKPGSFGCTGLGIGAQAKKVMAINKTVKGIFVFIYRLIIRRAVQLRDYRTLVSRSALLASSRLAIVARLSYAFLPLARAISILACPSLR